MPRVVFETLRKRIAAGEAAHGGGVQRLFARKVMVETAARQPRALHYVVDADGLEAVAVEENTRAIDDARTSPVFVMSCVGHVCVGRLRENMFLNILCQRADSLEIEEKIQMTTTATPPQAIQVSVLRWAPPIVHGLVRDLRVRWALEEAGWPYRENVVSPATRRARNIASCSPSARCLRSSATG